MLAYLNMDETEERERTRESGHAGKVGRVFWTFFQVEMFHYPSK